MGHDKNDPPQEDDLVVTDGMILDKLRETRDLIAELDRWTTYAPARTSFGLATTPTAEDATCWCATGALARVTNKQPGWSRLYEMCRVPLHTAAIEVTSDGGGGITFVNDKLGHLQTLHMFDIAIGLVEQRIEEVGTDG